MNKLGCPFFEVRLACEGDGAENRGSQQRSDPEEDEVLYHRQILFDAFLPLELKSRAMAEVLFQPRFKRYWVLRFFKYKQEIV